jgi:hypothetical protein
MVSHELYLMYLARHTTKDIEDFGSRLAKAYALRHKRLNPDGARSLFHRRSSLVSESEDDGVPEFTQTQGVCPDVCSNSHDRLGDPRLCLRTRGGVASWRASFRLALGQVVFEGALDSLQRCNDRLRGMWSSPQP